MGSDQSKFLLATMRSISEDTTLYDAGGMNATLFNLTDGEIWANKSDGYIKKRLTKTYQTAIRIAKPRHTSKGTTGSYYSKVEETQLTIQIDVFSRNGEDYCDDLLRILEGKFLSCVEKLVDGVNYFLDVDDLMVQDAFEDSDVEAMHGVLTLNCHYRGSVAT
jgi:hypothetical protein